MQDRYLYEYAVIRIVPQVEREEFINAGIVLYCKKEKFIKVKYKIDLQKLKCFTSDLDLLQLESNLSAFECIAMGQKDGGRIAQFDVAERFRWLTATRSSVIQTSKTHPGLCNDLYKTVERLFEELVL